MERLNEGSPEGKVNSTMIIKNLRKICQLTEAEQQQQQGASPGGKSESEQSPKSLRSSPSP